ncbi:MAG: hypothetical protein KA200_00115 [Burkholderiales bacterium]|nr:hypothetical protein [Burkholderiales bacterium]
MILDERTELADAVALNTGAAGTYLIGDQIDLGSVQRDVGAGEPVYLVVTVDTTATSGGSATLTLKVSSDSTASIATDGSATDHIVSRTFALASITAGATLLCVALPQEGAAYERYLGLLQVTGTAAFTDGKLNAFLTADPNRIKAYADAIA